MNALPGFRIGELAARSGRSAHAIRWYDAQGLIPGVLRNAAGQRRFTARHVHWLAFVERLRSTGMSIAQIRAYTRLVQQGPRNLTPQRALLAAHRERVAGTIAGWQEALALIDAKLAFYDTWIASGERPATQPAARGRAVVSGAAQGTAASPATGREAALTPASTPAPDDPTRRWSNPPPVT
jgi:DNA-binding transcriptional MerR regulator